MKQHNPSKDRLALSISYQQRADALLAGRGFWNGRVICNNPVKCKKKRDELEDLSQYYFNEHMINNSEE